MYNRTTYAYSYWSFLKASCLVPYCCCCCKSACQKRLDRLKLHEQSVDRMNVETDIVGIIQALRQSAFYNRTMLKKYQSYFLNKVPMYHLNADYETNERLVEKNNTREALIEAGFNEENYDEARIDEMVQQLTIENEIDKRIVKELQGKPKVRR